MFENPAPAPHGSQRRGKAAAIVALGLAFAGALDVQRLTGPELSPALARWVTDNRVRAVITAGVSGFIPRIDAGQVEIAAAGLDE